MAKVRVGNWQTTITTREGKKIGIDKRYEKIKTRYIKKGIQKVGTEKVFNKDVKPKFEKFFKDKNKGRTRSYYFKVHMSLNLKGKRIKKFYSIPRKGLKSKIGFNKAMKTLLSKMKKDVIKYLNRKDMNSISIRGVESEVSKGIKSSKRKTSKKPRRKK